MHVDSIANGANLKKYSNMHQELFAKVAMSGHERVSLCKVFAYWEMLGIIMHYKPPEDGNNEKMCLSQISFFKFVDLVGLLTMFQSNVKYYIAKGWVGLQDEERYLDVYDIQPFRQHLFESKKATAEINLILRDMGYTDKSVKINNYDNNMEFEINHIKNMLLYCAHLIDSWEHFEHLNYLREAGWTA